MTDKQRTLTARQNSKPLYVYNADKTLLLYYTNSTIQFVREMDVCITTVSKYLKTKLPLYGKLVLFHELLEQAIPGLSDTTKMSSFMTSARQLQKSTHMSSPETRAKIMASNKRKVEGVTMIHLSDRTRTKPSFSFDSIQQAYEFSRIYAPNRTEVLSGRSLIRHKKQKDAKFIRNTWKVIFTSTFPSNSNTI